jgi:hypothetical protein
MNKFFLGCLLIVGLSACSVNKQAQQIKALEQCDYKLLDASEITIAGTDVKKLVSGQSINLMSAPALALAFLRKDIPLRANLKVEIKNPSDALAAINNFDYIILINKQELVNGTVNQKISIDAGQTTTVPLQLNANIYQFLSNEKILDDVTKFLTSASNGTESKGMLTIKIKPSILVGENLVKYPGYISIDKEVSSKILL